MTDELTDTPLKPPRRSIWKTLALSTALLLSGVAIGVGVTLIGIRSRLDDFRSRPELLSQRMLERMEADLSLTEKQAEEIRKIFASSHGEAEAMRQRNRAQAQAFFREFQGKVAQVLTPSQQAEWEEWFRKARERAMRGRPGGPPGERDGKKDDRTERGTRDGEPAPGPDSEIGPIPHGIPEIHFAPEPGPRDDGSPPPPPDR